METSVQIDNINEILINLSDPVIKEVKDFAAHLFEKQRKHDAFVARVLDIDNNPDYIECDSSEETMNVIRNWKE